MRSKWMWAAVALACSAPAVAAEQCLAVVATNDVHGHIDPEVHKSGSLEVSQGGLATFASYLQVMRAKYPGRTVLLDGGDLFQGTVASNLSHGSAVIAAYNALGYQGAAVGNHEFDFGAEGDPKDLQGAIKRRIAEAHFPFLACNVYLRGTNQRPGWKNLLPSTLITVDGIKVGLVGAMTVDTPNVTLPPHVANLEFRPAAPEIAREAKRLRAQGARLVVLLAHIGGRCKDLTHPDELATCDTQSELFDTLRALPPGAVDIAVGGHTHQYVEHRVNGVAVTENGSYSRSFGWVEACVPSSGPVRTTLHPPVEVCATTWPGGGCQPRKDSTAPAATGAPTAPGAQRATAAQAATGVQPATFLGEQIHPSPSIDQLLQPYREKVIATNSAPTGVTLAVPLAKDRDRPSALGRLIAESLRRAVPGAEVAVMNSGGIRAPLPAGPLRYGQIFEVLPFDNHVVALQLTGAQLEQMLLEPVKAGHGSAQLAGARIDTVAGAPKVVLDSGAALVPDKLYRVATNDFLADGGDGLKELMAQVPKEQREDRTTLMRDAFLDYLKTLPQPVRP